MPVDAATDDLDEEALLRAPVVRLAFERLKASATLELALSERLILKKRPLIRDREIVLEDAFLLPEAPAEPLVDARVSQRLLLHPGHRL